MKYYIYVAEVTHNLCNGYMLMRNMTLHVEVKQNYYLICHSCQVSNKIANKINN